MKNLGLHRLESKSWRANQQDGLFDLFFGILFLGLGMGSLAEWLGGAEIVNLLVLMGIQFGGALLLWLGRRRYTAPRVGRVLFAAPRKRRIRTTRIVLGACVAVTATIVVLTAVAGRSGGLFAGSISRYTVSATASVLVFLPLAAIAYFQEFPRVLVHAGLFAAAEFGGTVLERLDGVPFPCTIAFGAAALISATIGIVIFTRFMRIPIARMDEEADDEA